MRHSTLLSAVMIALAASAMAVDAQPLSTSVRAHAVGTAIYEIDLKPNRTVAKIRVVKTSGSRRLDEHGAAELKTWKFAKAPPGVSKVRVPMTFTDRLSR